MIISNGKKPILITLALLIVSSFIRADVNESPLHEAQVASQQSEPSPLEESIEKIPAPDEQADEKINTPILDDATQKSKKHHPINILDTLVDDTKKQIDQIYTLLSGLSAMINDGQVPMIRNKKDVLHTIKEINNLIQNIRQEKFVHIDLPTMYFLLQFNDALMTHILYAAQSNFVHFTSFDPAPLIKRSFSQEVSIQTIERLIQKNKLRLKRLSLSIDRAGLRWYNLAYRKFDRTVIQPCKKYSIPSRTLMAAAGGATAIYLWWRFSNKSFENNCPKFIYNNIFGPRPITGGHGFIMNENELKALGKIEHNLAQLGHGFLPIGAAITAFTIGALKGEWDGEKKGGGLKSWITEKIAIAHNKMLGGAHLKEAQKLAKIVDEVTFEDLVGLDHVKDSFKQLVSYLENPESFDRLGLTPPKGILLVGETRTGKSFSVKALFGEIKRMLKRSNRKDEFVFLEFNASEINQHGIQYLLNLVKKVAPCIVFIDEIDLLDLQRKGKNQMLSELLTCMSGTLDSKDPKNQVVIIGATNMPENLDSALRQPGRFGREHRFEYPSFTDRKTFILRKLNKLSLNINLFNVDKITRETEGKSYEALNVLINNALLKARIHGNVLTQQYIDETLDTELRHIINNETKQIPEHQQQLLAAHFAGHALALTLLNTHTKLSKVTIKQVMTNIKEEIIGMHLYRKEEDDKQKRFEYGNVFTYHNNDCINNMYTQDETLALCKFHLAGIAAEQLLLGSCSYSCHKEDKSRALSLAQTIAFEGLDIAHMPKHVQAQRHDAALAIVAQCEREVRQLLETNRNALNALAQALSEKRTLAIHEVEAIIKQHTTTP